MKKIILILLMAFSQFAETPSIIAQSKISKENLQALKYRMVGPTRGGRVSTVVGINDQLFTFFMGTTGGGVWKTEDAGQSWKNISDKDFKVGSIGAIAIAPSAPNVMYVGTGSPDPRGNVSAGNGVYKSMDGGESWTHIGLEKSGQIGKIVVDPNDPNIVVVGVLGNIFGPNSERGIYRTEDGGSTWTRTLFISEKTGCIDLDIDLSNPRILYAGMWTAERKPHTFIDGSDEGGVWKSIDGGKTWKRLENGLPTGIVGRVGLSISQANPKVIYVIQEAKDETKGGVFRSTDGGNSFSRVNREHKLRQRAWYYNRIHADPQDEHTVYISNVGFHKSIDGGKSFSRIRTPHSDHHALWINPNHPNIMIQGNDGGACVTLNGGATWSSQNNQPTAEFYRLTVDNQFPYHIYGAQQDNSTMRVPSRTITGLTNTSEWKAVGGGESGHIAVDPRDPNIVYAGTYIGTITRKNFNTGYSENINGYPQMHDGQAFRDIKYRFQWNAPIRISPHNPDVVYHCSQYVHRTKDGGQTWEIISPDLTTNKDEYQDIPGEPVQHDHTGVELYTTIFAFEESPKNAGELWAGTDDGRLHISKDDGENWEEITPKNIPKEGTINMIELSNHSEGRALIAVYKYRENDFRPYIFLTNDFGKNWTSLCNGSNGIPENHFVRVVREDPNRKGLLYAGTEFGMYISFDEGKNWQLFQLNLPYTPITDMAIKNKDLVIATQGRSFWVLDDLSPLYELSQTEGTDAYLFQPSDAYRYQVQGGADVDRIPHGAIIYFHLKSAPTKDTPVQLSILDRDGQKRRIFSSHPDKSKNEEKLTAKKGLNRFVWNMKYEGLETQPNSYFSLANTGGIKAPTGKHSVVLSKGTEELKRNFQLKKDPRWTQTHADILAQYELAMQVKSTFNNCHKSIGNLRSVRTQINNKLDLIKDKPGQNEVTERGKAIVQELNSIEEKLIQTKSESGQDPINYPSMIDDQIAYLYSVVNGNEGGATEGAKRRFSDLKEELSPILTELKTQKEAVEKWNQLLIEQGLGGVLTE
jgi:photosystem II stability/assembly factor-like uncharacterized protein